ncbi:hypothetical protein [Terriglobus aquaticus]|uniref:Uncharacterized protein n=1 Tax=Terriglobus aquaticus TaxID=940139 RepID=A0ABW9KG57_9BACT|nr:hypothetical protein [Terriglobus aquaticus]
MNRRGTVSGVFLLLACAAPAAFAQGAYPPPPQAFASIVRQAPQQSSFTLDRSMLTAADGFLNGSSPDGRRIAAGLNSITFTNFHYHDYAGYDGAAFAALNSAYEAAGFHHMVNANANSRAPMLTDLWLRTQGAMVTNVVVLTRGDRNMNAITVDCNLRPLDLLHLSGHFGIPQVDANAVMVPAGPGGAPPPAYGPSQVPDVATGPVSPAPNSAPQPLQNPPTLHHHSANDPQ